METADELLPSGHATCREAVLLEHALQTILQAVHELEAVLLEQCLALFLFLLPLLLLHRELPLQCRR